MMAEYPGALDSIIRETVQQKGGIDIDGDARASLAIRAGILTKLFEVGGEGLPHLNPGLSVERQIEAWLDAGAVADARRLLAHALPPRHAMWWALLALVEAHGRVPYPGKVVEAFTGVRDFLLNPSEEARRACHDLAEAADASSAGGAIGYAAFLSCGSMAPPDCPPVLPKAHLCGHLCGVAVYLASVQFDPIHYKEHNAQFVRLGLRVARGELALPDQPARAAELPAAAPELEREVARADRASAHRASF